MSGFDRRITAARPDLAALSLKGIVQAAHFVAGESARIIAPSAAVLREPRPDAAIDTEALAGEALMVYERHEGFAWVQLATDRYVGYVAETALSMHAPAPGHKLGVLRSFVYPGPSMKLAPTGHLSLGAAVHIVAITGEFAELATGGFIWRQHLVPLGHAMPDAVAIAEWFIGTPYLWGGKTSLGLDCSGLVQLALGAAGMLAPRDSDMQEAQLGHQIALAGDLSGLQRGDIMFWKGHVGLMRDATTLIHANGHHMLVVSEPLAEAAARIVAKGAGPITSARRIRA